jgi:DNA-binding GntR family transcriptional regulator
VQNRFPSFCHDSHEKQIALLSAILKEDVSEAKWLLREHLQQFIDRSMQLSSEQNADKALTL